jgi:hypothetical protein
MLLEIALDLYVHRNIVTCTRTARIGRRDRFVSDFELISGTTRDRCSRETKRCVLSLFVNDKKYSE